MFRASLIETNTFCFFNQEKMQTLSISVYRAYVPARFLFFSLIHIIIVYHKLW